MDLEEILLLCFGKKKSVFDFSSNACSCFYTNEKDKRFCSNRNCRQRTRKIPTKIVRHCKVNLFKIHIIKRKYCSVGCQKNENSFIASLNPFLL